MISNKQAGAWMGRVSDSSCSSGKAQIQRMVNDLNLAKLVPRLSDFDLPRYPTQGTRPIFRGRGAPPPYPHPPDEFAPAASQ